MKLLGMKKNLLMIRLMKNSEKNKKKEKTYSLEKDENVRVKLIEQRLRNNENLYYI